MFEDLRSVFVQYTKAELARDLTEAKIPWAEVNDLRTVAELPAVATRLTRTRMPDGREIRLQPLPVDQADTPRELSFPPRYGQHTEAILRELQFDEDEVRALIDEGVVLAATAGNG